MTTRNGYPLETLGAKFIENLSGTEMERKFEAAGMGSEGYMSFVLAKTDDEKMKFFERILGTQYIKNFKKQNDTEYPLFALSNLYIAWVGTI